MPITFVILPWYRFTMISYSRNFLLSLNSWWKVFEPGFHSLCTFISSRLDFIELCHLRDPDIESQWFVIKPNRLPRGINSIILGTVYHPPQNDDNKLRAHLFSSLDSALASYPNSAIVVLGDFNQFKHGNLCSSFKLKRLVTKPTRGNKILDQAYSTMSQYYDEALILPPVGP